MEELIEMVAEFNDKFGLKNVCPQLTCKMLQEELNELKDALRFDHSSGKWTLDKIEGADAYGDLLYLIAGGLISAKLDKKVMPVLREIHSSNLSKIEDGVVLKNEIGKVIKGKNYFKPNIAKILEEY